MLQTVTEGNSSVTLFLITLEVTVGYLKKPAIVTLMLCTVRKENTTTTVIQYAWRTL
jgi:hypothetical protein